MRGASLVVQALTKRHPGHARPVLDGVDLVASAGRILVLLGTSGAGKTTLLRLVAGLERPDGGTIALESEDGSRRVLTGPGVHVAPQQRDVGLVFQHLELWPHMTVAEHIAFGLPGRLRHRKAVGHATVRELTERVGVGALLARLPGTLSGGERQRVAIARTLAGDPAVILYDEPLANLDPARRAELRALIRALSRERGSTLVYVTHDAEEALALGDEVAVLGDGRVLERAPPEVLYRRPRTLLGARALGPVNVLRGTRADGGIDTPLGRMPLPPEAPREGPVVFVLRPEDLRAHPGNQAEVLESRPRGADWSVMVRVGSAPFEARAKQAFAPGSRVALEVQGSLVAVQDGGPDR